MLSLLEEVARSEALVGLGIVFGLFLGLIALAKAVARIWVFFKVIDPGVSESYSAYQRFLYQNSLQGRKSTAYLVALLGKKFARSFYYIIISGWLISLIYLGQHLLPIPFIYFVSWIVIFLVVVSTVTIYEIVKICRWVTFLTGGYPKLVPPASE